MEQKKKNFPHRQKFKWKCFNINEIKAPEENHLDNWELSFLPSLFHT